MFNSEIPEMKSMTPYQRGLESESMTPPPIIGGVDSMTPSIRGSVESMTPPPLLEGFGIHDPPPLISSPPGDN